MKRSSLPEKNYRYREKRRRSRLGSQASPGLRARAASRRLRLCSEKNREQLPLLKEIQGGAGVQGSAAR